MATRTNLETERPRRYAGACFVWWKPGQDAVQMRPRYIDSESTLELSLEKIVGEYIAADELIFSWDNGEDCARVLLIRMDVYREGAELYKALGVCGGSGRVLRFTRLAEGEWRFAGEATWIN